MSAAASTVERATTAAERADAAREELDAELARVGRKVLLHGPWSAEEFLELPTSDTNRIELVNGSLLMTPRPESGHQRAAFNLTNMLQVAAPDDWDALPEVNLRLGPSTILAPDVLVLTQVKSVTVYEAADVALVVEIESPSSRDTDRSLKPYQYASAGIEWYLRVELKGPNTPKVVVYRLQGEEYVEHTRAHAGQTLELTEPVKLSFDPAVLLHRRLPTA